MVRKTQSNFFLVSANIIALAHFITPRSSWALIVFLSTMHVPYFPRIKTKMHLVSIFSLLAAFIEIGWLSEFFCSCALGLAMNSGYSINSPHAPSVINFSLAFGVIMGYVIFTDLQKFSTGKDIFLLMFTMPNLFMAQSSQSSKQNKKLLFINPLMDATWTYALGFSIGIFLPLSSVSKHIRFFIISLILLLSLFTDNQLYWKILSFIRGLFIYNQSVHLSQFYFRLGFLVFDFLLNQYLFNYMFIGYLVMAVIFWQDQPHEMRTNPSNANLKEPLVQQEMQSMKKGEKNTFQN